MIVEMTQSKWLVWAAVASVCIAAGALVALLPANLTTAPAAILTWAAAIALGVIAWKTLLQRSLVGLVLVYGFLGFGAAAALLYQPTSADLTGPNAAVAQIAQQTQGYHYLLIFIVAAYAIWGASLTVGVLFPLRDHRLLTLTALDLSPMILPLAVLPLFANVYGTGIGTVLHASRYLEHTGPAAAALMGKALGPIGVLTCGYFTFHRREPLTTRTCALLIALAYEAMFLAQDTRFFAFWVPLMFAGGLLTGTWSVSRQRFAFVAVVVASVLALQIPLGLRNLPNHGLIPAIRYLVHQPALVFGSHDPINNLLFGAPLTLFVAHDIQSLPISDVVTSMSPLPSRFNNWSQIALHLRLNIYTPYSALGELLNHGWGFFALLMCSFGAAFALAERLALRRPGIVGGLSQMVVLGAAALFVVESTEYNLRSVARLVYYVVIAVGALAVVQVWIRPREQDPRLARYIQPERASG
jgi:hypothetical protein